MFTKETEQAIYQMAGGATNDLTYFGETAAEKRAELAEAILPCLEMSYPAAILEIRAAFKERGFEVVLAEMAGMLRAYV